MLYGLVDLAINQIGQGDDKTSLLGNLAGIFIVLVEPIFSSDVPELKGLYVPGETDLSIAYNFDLFYS